MQPVDGHQLAAQFVIGRMQRHGQRHVGLLGQLVHLRHQAAGRQRQPAPGKIETYLVEQDAQRRHDIAEIGQRLTHAHQHHIADQAVVAGLKTQLLLSQKHLTDDLGRGEVAVKALLRG